jgi:hypothetical protein
MKQSTQIYIMSYTLLLFAYGKPNLAEFNVHTACRNIRTDKGKTGEHVSDHPQTV